jgi:hypothetical protein
MKTEWLALWIHFLWSGILTMSFAFLAWSLYIYLFFFLKISLSLSSPPPPSPQLPPNFQTLAPNLPKFYTYTDAPAIRWKIGIRIGPFAKYAQDSAAGRETMKKRRRLLQIAAMVSVCLLLNMYATLATSEKLEEWSRTTDIFLACSIKEKWHFRNWEAYGLNDGNVVNVCSRAEAHERGGTAGCDSDCFWDPSLFGGNSLVCLPGGLKFESFEEYAEQTVSDPKYGIANSQPCDCPCTTLIQVEKPRSEISTGVFI